jgi:hypothetical protein
MREGIDIEVSAADRARLVAVVGDCNSPKSMCGGRGSFWSRRKAAVRRRLCAAGVSKPCVWRWQERPAYRVVMRAAETEIADIHLSRRDPYFYEFFNDNVLRVVGIGIHFLGRKP